MRQVTAVRTRAGADNPSGSSVDDLYGDLALISDHGIAQVYWPRDWQSDETTVLPPPTPAVVEAGLRALRRDARPRLEELAPRGLDAARRREYDRSMITDPLEHGVWVNYRDGTHFTLIIPRTGQPLKNPDQTPWVVSLDEVLAAGAGAPPPREPTGLRFGPQN